MARSEKTLVQEAFSEVELGGLETGLQETIPVDLSVLGNCESPRRTLRVCPRTSSFAFPRNFVSPCQDSNILQAK